MWSKPSSSESLSRSFPRSRTPSLPIPFPSGVPGSSFTPATSTGRVLHQPHTTQPSTTEDFEVIRNIPNSQSFYSDTSKRTSSDKLSALPPTLPTPPRTRYPIQNLNRNLRSPDGSPLPLRNSPSSSPPPAPNLYRPSASEGSPAGKDSSRQRRVSFESDHSVGTLHSIRQIANRIGGQSGSSPSAGVTSLPPTNQRGRSNSQSSRTQSRATSPLRLFQWSLHRAHSREDPFVAVDPFKWHFRICNIPPGQPKPDEEQASCVAPLSCCFPSSTTKSSPQVDTLFSNSRSFLFDTFPRQLYLNCLLRLPSLYFSRVARVFEDAEVSKGDMQRIIDSARGKSIGGQTIGQGGRAGGTAAPQNTSEVGVTLPFPNDWVPPAVSIPLARFKHSWEDFIDSLMREWKTLNLVSALLCSAILSMFQVQEMADDPVTRTAALISLVCALMSLSYGCIFIVRFGTMRSMHRASRWAEEARKTKTAILWNVWVMLAIPTVWIAWSMIAFIVSILSYVWRTGSTNDPTSGAWPQLTPQQSLGPRLAVTAIVLLGLVYFALIVNTFAQYGKGGLNNEPLSATSGTVGVSEEPTRGRERERRYDGKSGKMGGLPTTVQPSGIGSEFDLEKGGSSREDKDGGGRIEREVQTRGWRTAKL